MILAHSRVTSQGQISVPAAVRRRLGLEPGAVLEWEECNGCMMVRRVGRFSSEDIHRALFPSGSPTYKSDAEIKAGMARYVKGRYERR